MFEENKVKIIEIKTQISTLNEHKKNSKEDIKRIKQNLNEKMKSLVEMFEKEKAKLNEEMIKLKSSMQVIYFERTNNIIKDQNFYNE